MWNRHSGSAFRTVSLTVQAPGGKQEADSPHLREG